MAPKYHLIVQWVVGEVVGIENAVAFHPLSRLALAASSANPPRRGFASRAYNAIRHDNNIKCYSSSVTMISASSSISKHSLVVGVHELVHGLGNTPNTSCARSRWVAPRKSPERQQNTSKSWWAGR
jgi:hypothetical protein